MEKQISSQAERLAFLIDALKNESDEYRAISVPHVYDEQRLLFRSLMNVRLPHPIAPEVLRAQDDFLQTEARENGIVSLADIPTAKTQYASAHKHAKKLSIWQGDITRLHVGAIVNAANSQLLGCFIPCHRCIDNAIHSGAGMQLREACNELMQKKRAQFGSNYEAPTGCAEITEAFNLPSSYVIHTVGPIVSSHLTEQHCDNLRSCYKNVLTCAKSHNVRSVAFCCISTGEFHFPNDAAVEIAINTVSDFLADDADAFDRIIFNVFIEADKKLYEQLLA